MSHTRLMNPRTRMLALSAAAKVTLVGAFACEKAPMVTAETAPGPAPTSDAAVAPLPTIAKAPPPAASMCGVDGSGASTTATLQCCQEAISAVTAAMRKPIAPDEIACCAALARANDESMRAGRGFQEMPSRAECCETLGWKGSMTCTPWGPPVPPEIDWVA